MSEKISYRRNYKFLTLIFTLLWWNIGFRIFIFMRFAGSVDVGLEGVSRALLLFKENYLLGFFVATIMGLFIWFFERVSFPHIVMRAGNVKASLLRPVFYIVSITLISLIANYYHFMVELGYSFGKSSKDFISFIFNETWLFFLLVGFFINFTMNIFIAAQNHLGKGNLRKILTGRFQQPQEENRIFMFLDLVSSSRTAEILGHQKYSYFIQDCFRELSEVILVNAANVYQYVGDEVVLTWKGSKSKNYWRSINFYYDFVDRLKRKNYFFEKKYGLKPYFKAAVNCGNVMVAEVGELKSEIAYHGDVLNTASRVQKTCKNYDQDIIVTEQFVKAYGGNPDLYSFYFIDEIEFTGKERKVSIYSVNKKSDI